MVKKKSQNMVRATNNIEVGGNNNTEKIKPELKVSF